MSLTGFAYMLYVMGTAYLMIGFLESDLHEMDEFGKTLSFFLFLPLVWIVGFVLMCLGEVYVW